MVFFLAWNNNEHTYHIMVLSCDPWSNTEKNEIDIHLFELKAKEKMILSNL